ncbi:MAG: 4Fe-4S binding protein [Methanomassiliicoccales archaeon]
MAENISLLIGSAFLFLALAAVAILARKGRLGGRMHLLLMAVAVALGFILFAPVLPFQLMSFLQGGDQAPQLMAAVLIVAVLALALLMGRLYCGGACPIGSLQELLYLIPGKKVIYADRKKLFAVRGVVLLAMIIAVLAGHSNPLIALGVKSTFSLQASGSSLIFIAILLVSVFWYRPFCRILCPYGALMTISSSKIVIGLRRNQKCVSCSACEKACPTGESYQESAGRDCYLCGRCTQRCKFNAIEYDLKEKKK